MKRMKRWNAAFAYKVFGYDDVFNYTFVVIALDEAQALTLGLARLHQHCSILSDVTQYNVSEDTDGTAAKITKLK